MEKTIEVSAVFPDWITAVGTTMKTNEWLRIWLGQDEASAIQRGYHRSHAVEYYPSGVKHYYNAHDLDVGSVLVFTGSCLGNLRDNADGSFTQKMAVILARKSSHFSRIDLTCDIYDNGATAHEVAGKIIRDQLDTGRRSATVVQKKGIRNGVTTYIGARSSPKLMRIYDKSAESGGEIQATRLEIELKAEAAEAFSTHLQATIGERYRTFTPIFTGILAEMADWTGVKYIEDLRYGEVRELPIGKRERLMEKKAWLKRQVMPTFAKKTGQADELWSWFKELIETNSA